MTDAQVRADREAIEWCNLRWNQAPDCRLPRVLLIGDSIAQGYHQTVSDQLAGVACIDLLATSKAIADPALGREIAYAMEGYGHAVVHLNNGLHGWHVTEDDYAAHLRLLVTQLRDLAPRARLIWASSTPVTELDQPARPCAEKNPIVQARNAVASRIMVAQRIPVNDLYAQAAGKPDWRSNDGYHYNATGQAALGQAVAAAIRQHLP